MARPERRRRLRRDAGSAGPQASDPATDQPALAPSGGPAAAAGAGLQPAAAASQPLPPWLTPELRRIAARIVAGHASGFGRPLMARTAPEHLAEELFSLDTVVMAHDGADPGGDPGPRLIYANAAALRLWRRPWREQVGMPSRLTAEPQERPDRARMLVSALEQHAIRGYCGIRIDSHGRRFQIRGARLWTLRDADGQPCGQAAAFDDWWWL